MTDSYRACILAARAELSAARQHLIREISGYPTPISGCDAQFNHLLSERQKVVNALAELDSSVFVPTPRHPTQAASVESR